jgi:hypothetical protein
MAVTLSCGDNGALGPPISVLTHPGLSKTQVMPRGAKSIAALRITIGLHGSSRLSDGFGFRRRAVRADAEMKGPPAGGPRVMHKRLAIVHNS